MLALAKVLESSAHRSQPSVNVPLDSRITDMDMMCGVWTRCLCDRDWNTVARQLHWMLPWERHDGNNRWSTAICLTVRFITETRENWPMGTRKSQCHTATVGIPATTSCYYFLSLLPVTTSCYYFPSLLPVTTFCQYFLSSSNTIAITL